MSNTADGPDLEQPNWITAVALVFGLNARQWVAVVLLAWSAAMSLHVAWACGWLGFLGASGFASAQDLNGLSHTVNVSAQINLARELRDQISLRCRVTDPATRAALDRYIEYLQLEYVNLTRQRYPEACG